MNATAVTTFTSIWALGYQRLVPIIPPDATVTVHSGKTVIDYDLALMIYNEMSGELWT